MKMIRGYGSVGRASRSQREGQRFESAYLHQVKPKLNHLWFDLGFLFYKKVEKILKKLLKTIDSKFKL